MLAVFVCALLISACAQAAAAPSTVARGEYLATLGDCVVCHTSPRSGQRPYAGGRGLHARFGVVYSSNLTPDKETGIGTWTPDQFYRALTRGVDNAGNNLYPAFPYVYFKNITRDDSDALFAYFRSLRPVHYTPPRNRLIFPANIRPLMAIWNWLFFDHSKIQIDRTKSAAWNRGDDLVNGLAHCGGCHTPKNFFFADQNAELLQGGRVESWFAPNLTQSPKSGLGKWSSEDIVQYLKTGTGRFGRAAGSMREVVDASTSQMSEPDLNAIASYLKSMPPSREPVPTQPDPAIMAAGRVVYVQHCGACHDKGPDYPTLWDNGLVNAANGTTAVRVILFGSPAPTSADGNIAYSMPAFGALSDNDIAAVTTYIRNSHGNAAGVVRLDAVKSLRQAVATLEH